LSLFPWAPFRSTKAAIKRHTLLDLRGAIPDIRFQLGRQTARRQRPEGVVARAGCHLHDGPHLRGRRAPVCQDDAGAFFVTRAKSSFTCRRVYSMPVDRNTGLICDQHIELTGFYSKQGYGGSLRGARYKDPKTGKSLVSLTNHFAENET